MAFINKIGKLLKHTAVKHINLELSASTSSIYQAIRSMSSAKLFIGGISYGTDGLGLREAFAQYGEIIDARVVTDRETGRSRGFGFITYVSSEDASAAIQAMDGQDLHGRRIRVNFAMEKSRPGFSDRSGGFYGGGGGGGSSSSSYARGNYGGSDSYRNGSYGRSSYVAQGSYGSSDAGTYDGSGSGNYGVSDGLSSGYNYQPNENASGDIGIDSCEFSSNSSLGLDGVQFSKKDDETSLDDGLKENNDDDYPQKQV